MKRISTLLSMLCFVLTASAQISETFDGANDLSSYQGSCWNFTSVTLATSTPFNSNSLMVSPSTSTSGAGQITTPFINWTAGSTLTFKLKINNKLSTMATRTIGARLLSLDGSYSPTLTTLMLDKSSDVNTTYEFMVSVAAASIQKLVIDVTGNGDGNTSLFIDDITYASSYNYTGSYDCKAVPVTAPLPIKLVSFSGTINNNKVQLAWTADDNETGHSFEVEKSGGDNKFKTIALISTTDKVGRENYTYTDATENAGYSNYRLKIINKDHSITYSKIIACKAKGTEHNSSLTLLQNPITSSLSFTYAAPVNGQYSVALYSSTGIKVLSKMMVFQKGTNTTVLSVNSNLASGTYILEVASSTGRNTIKVAK